MFSTVERAFSRVGARVRIRDERTRWDPPTFSIDVAHDKRGPVFDLRLPEAPADDFDLLAVDVRPDLRHLLLLVRQEGRKDKFLCGHDERHWFTCAVPGGGVVGVISAMNALKPVAVRAAEFRAALPEKDKRRRRNAVFVRQGEWFFLPQPELAAPRDRVRRNEPISRGGGGKPHRVEELYRFGGELVYVCGQYPRGLSADQHRALLKREPRFKHVSWQPRFRDAAVYARGRISHEDHATIVLPTWHRVLMNTEAEAPAARHVTFLD